MGFTQRQAAGKFTRDEADDLIAALQDDEARSSGPVAPVPRLTAAERALREIPVEALAAELQRRGWVVLEP